MVPGIIAQLVHRSSFTLRPYNHINYAYFLYYVLQSTPTTDKALLLPPIAVSVTRVLLKIVVPSFLCFARCFPTVLILLLLLLHRVAAPPPGRGAASTSFFFISCMHHQLRGKSPNKLSHRSIVVDLHSADLSISCHVTNQSAHHHRSDRKAAESAERSI